MNGLQCRLARTALSIGVRDLAEMAGVSTNTITRLEGGEELKSQTVANIRTVLENAGVIFIDESGQGPGVRIRKS